MSVNTSTINYLIIDWGTTNFRAFAMSPEHQLIETKEAPLGLLQVPNGNFAKALQTTLESWIANYQRLPIYMAGMVGSMKGWVNVDYAATPTGISKLLSGAYQFDLPWGSKATIFPGVSHQYQLGKYDVMRGEEIQLLGVAVLSEQTEFNAILPGTHSKHAYVINNKIESFASYLTGEFYSVLINHSLLGKGLEQAEEFNLQAFLKGVDDCKGSVLTNRAFLTWTHRLFDQISADEAPDYLSGLLIGYELREFHAKFSYLVGGNSLCLRYQKAAEHLGINTEIMSGNECFLAGMISLIKERK